MATYNGYPNRNPSQPPPYLGPGGYDDKGDDNNEGRPQIGGPPSPSRFFKCILCIIIFVILLVVITIVVLLIIFHPSKGTIKLESLSTSDFNLSEALLSAAWDVNLTFTNPNDKLYLFFETMDVKVQYKHHTIGSGHLQDFKLGFKTQETMPVKVVSNSTHFSEHRVDELNWERANRGSIKVDVEIKGRWMVKVPWPIKRSISRHIDVKCKELEVGLGSNSTSGAYTGGSQECV